MKQATPSRAELAQNPFNADLVAAIDSPRYTGGEHRIAFSDQSNGIDGYVYAKTLNMAVARAEFATKAVNAYASGQAKIAALVAATEEAHKAIADLLEHVGGIDCLGVSPSIPQDTPRNKAILNGVNALKNRAALASAKA